MRSLDNKNTCTATARVPVEWAESLDEIAKSQDVSRAMLVRRAIAQFLGLEDDEAARSSGLLESFQERMAALEYRVGRLEQS